MNSVTAEPAHGCNSYVTSLASMCPRPGTRAHYPSFLSLPPPAPDPLPRAAGAYMLVELNKIHKNQTHAATNCICTEQKEPFIRSSRFPERKNSVTHVTHTGKCPSQQLLLSAQTVPGRAAKSTCELNVWKLLKLAFNKLYKAFIPVKNGFQRHRYFPVVPPTRPT